MAALVDASVLIAAERGQLDLASFAADFGSSDLLISSITAAELLHGVHRAQSPAQRHRRSAFVENLLAQLPVLSFDLTVARLYAAVWAELAHEGIAVGERDLMIAVTALAAGGEILTRDARSFPKIPGLTVRFL